MEQNSEIILYMTPDVATKLQVQLKEKHNTSNSRH